MKNKTFAAFLTALLVTSSFTTAFAQTQAEQPVREAVKEKIEEKIEAKCEKADVVIEKIIELYTSTRRNHILTLNNFRKKYDELVIKLGTEGYNVSEFKTYSRNLEKKISNYTADLSSFIQALKESQKLACGESNGKYGQVVSNSKELLKKIRTDLQEIKAYYRDTIRPALINLKKEAQENKASTQQ
ncbi:hypothetical protein IT413_05600 [Candidatus Peregrinibacteria bacterium]|nr:hypothetical protein [Candidatus Peregrinibacteria bacterium]